jgi:hypothetical protein
MRGGVDVWQVLILIFFLMSGCRVVNFEWVCGVKGASCEGKASSSSLCFHVIDSA